MVWVGKTVNVDEPTLYERQPEQINVSVNKVHITKGIIHLVTWDVWQQIIKNLRFKKQRGGNYRYPEGIKDFSPDLWRYGRPIADHFCTFIITL